ncbi:Serine/threonine-protein phosphatase [Kluyveromyces marxianus]
MADLVWSDPEDDRNEFTSSQFKVSPRGAGYTFGRAIVDKFFSINGVTKMLRAHQLCNEGYQDYFGGKVTTVWSAPNYCYRCGNKASILELYSPTDFYFNVFDEAPENKLLTDPMLNDKTLHSFFDEEDGMSSAQFDVFSDEHQTKYAQKRQIDYFL